MCLGCTMCHYRWEAQSFTPWPSLRYFLSSFVLMLIGFWRALLVSFALRSRGARGHCGGLVPLRWNPPRWLVLQERRKDESSGRVSATRPQQRAGSSSCTLLASAPEGAGQKELPFWVWWWALLLFLPTRTGTLSVFAKMQDGHCRVWEIAQSCPELVP